MKPFLKTTLMKSPVIGGSVLSIFCAGIFALSSCSSGNGDNSESAKTETASDKGIGPVSKVEIGALDESLANTGKSVFESKCTACHKVDARHVGPALKDITKRRKPEWIMNMILNPVEMTQKDPVAKELLATYMAPMANQNLTQEEARAILEYFRNNDK